MKFLEDFGFKLDKINLGKLTIVINKTHIVFITTNRFKGSTPNIRKHKFKKMIRNTSRFWIWKVMTFYLLTSITH
jgi:hypothetical protein